MKDKIMLIFLVASYLILVTVITMVLVFFRAEEQFFFAMATAIILSWIIVLITYYMWAIYFYNVNMGWEDEDWDKLHSRKMDEGHGVLGDEPTVNPHAGETLGLPPGTIRGTMALSLLVAGLAMIIASFQLDQTYDTNSLFVDNFEFFKTAFLMMIAFYFGNKSLNAITSRNQGVYKPDQIVSQSQVGSTQPNNSSTFNPSTNADIPSSNLASGQAGILKNTLKTETSPETTDTGNATDFDDKESVG